MHVLDVVCFEAYYLDKKLFMSEKFGAQEPKPQDPELLPCQIAIKDLSEKILAKKPEEVRLTFWDVMSEADPNQVQDRLRASSLGDLMLQDGDTLSIPTPNDYYPDLDLYVGEARLTHVTLRAWGWDFDKHRIDPNGSGKSPYDVIEYPGEKDWSRQLDVSLHYANEAHQTAAQTITMQTGSTSAGILPSAVRDVYAMDYAETGYEGHNQVYRTATSGEEVMNFVNLVKELMGKE